MLRCLLTWLFDLWVFNTGSLGSEILTLLIVCMVVDFMFTFRAFGVSGFGLGFCLPSGLMIRVDFEFLGFGGFLLLEVCFDWLLV